jgi:hypothetical protein
VKNLQKCPIRIGPDVDLNQLFNELLPLFGIKCPG